jgi:hypothetical protein
MDDLSKFQKISSLARELMKHGQAQTMDEAMKLATQQVESGNIPVYMEGSAPAKIEAIPEVPEEIKLVKPSEAPNDAIIEQIEKLISGQQTTLSRMTGVVNAHTSQIQATSAQITQLLAEISQLREDVKKIKESPVAPALPKRDAVQGQTQFKPGSEIPSTSVRPTHEAPTSHARTGSFKPEDVSIEKFFSFRK